MRKQILTSSILLSVMLVATCMMAVAQDNADPVKITFDEDSKRVDLVTGRELPNYTRAIRGSLRFHLDRLDSPAEFFNYEHDGTNKGSVTGFYYMEKVQPQFSVWRIVGLSGFKNSPRIHDKAVSFIPLSPTTNEPERKVYVLLDDLQKIEWKEMD